MGNKTRIIIRETDRIFINGETVTAAIADRRGIGRRCIRCDCVKNWREFNHIKSGGAASIAAYDYRLRSYCRKCNYAYFTDWNNSLSPSADEKRLKHVRKYRGARAKRTIKMRVRIFLRRYKKIAGCSVCRSAGREWRWPEYVLHFHHLRDKKFNISDLRGGKGMVKADWTDLTKLKDEIRKCVVVCANCHAIIHAEERMGIAEPTIVAGVA